MAPSGYFEVPEEIVEDDEEVARGEAKPSRRFEFAPDDIKAIRKRLGRSQSEFALMISVSLSTLRNWEQGRRVP
jgi:putative transcriptional regulator